MTKNSTEQESFAEVFTRLYPDKLNQPLWKYFLSSYLEFDTGTDIERLSAKYFSDDEIFDGADELITNGYDTVATYLAESLDIRLNEIVESITYSESLTQVKTKSNSYTADFILCTVPLGYLKKGRIQFEPELPANKRQAIERLEMGNVNKFLLIWEVPFWDTTTQYVAYTATEKGKFNYFLNARTFSDINALMTFAFGNYAYVTENMSDAEIIDAIMNHLKTIFGESIPQPTAMQRTKWSQDEFTGGSYSFMTKGTTSASFDVLAEPVSNRLFFAEEHTSRMYRGTVHGAYLSGLREAERIITLL